VFVPILRICLLVAELEAALSSLRARYQTTDKVPDVASLINIDINTPLLENCLISCSNNEQCKAVGSKDGSCQLVNSGVRDQEKLSAKQIWWLRGQERPLEYGTMVTGEFVLDSI